MATVDTVRQMQTQGYKDSEIINSLQQQGISPREINDALNQSRIKNAVSDNSSENSQNNAFSSTQEIDGMQGMQPSLSTQEAPQQDYGENQEYNQNYSQEDYGNQYDQQDYSQGYPQGPIQPTTQEYSDNMPPQTSSQDYGYGNYEDPYSAYGTQGTDMMTETINQMINEKMDKTNKTISSLIEFKSLLTNKVEKIDERLKDVEKIINKLQMSLIRKANEQEQNITDIKNEMQHMQTSFGKIVNPLTDTVRDMEELIDKKSPKTKKHPKKKSSKKK
jgi:hypothetical protein